MSEEYEDMTVSELKDLLREKGLKVGGNKSELIARLSESQEQEEEVVEEALEEEGHPSIPENRVVPLQASITQWLEETQGYG